MNTPRGAGRRYRHSSKPAFTLIELLAVVAVILLVVALVVPLAGGARERGRRTVCLSNERQLQLAYNLCTFDRDGRLPSSDTENNRGFTSSNDWWAGTSDLTQGIVWPYVRSEKLYTCPSYPTPARDLLKRHYSLSSLLNSISATVDDHAPYTAVSLSQVKKPSVTHVLIEEYDNRTVASGPSPGAINGYAVQVDNGRWTDCPPTWHDVGANFSYLDGHVEYRRWRGPRMRAISCYDWFYNHAAQYWPTTPLDAEDWRYIAGGVTNGLHD